MTQNTHTTDAQTAKEALTDAAKTLHETDTDCYSITTDEAVVDYLGLDGYPRQDSHDEVTLITSSRNDTISATHYLYRTPDHGWVHVRTTSNNAGEHRVRHLIKHIGEVTFDGRGVDVDYLLDRCETREIGIDESHAETVDEWVQREAEGVADYVDDALAVVSDGTGLYMETHGRRIGELRSELEYEFVDKEWDVARKEIIGAIDTRAPSRLTGDVGVEYVVDLSYEPPY